VAGLAVETKKRRVIANKGPFAQTKEHNMPKKPSAPATEAAPAVETAAAPVAAAPAKIEAKSTVAFDAPLGLKNTGVVLAVKDGVAAVAVEVAIVTFPVGELELVK
jgi:hypothetical protein